MNNNRRRQIATAQNSLDTLIIALTEVWSDLENIRDDEQDYYDNMPEAIQQGEKGQTVSEAVDALNEVLEAIEALTEASAIDRLNDAQN